MLSPARKIVITLIQNPVYSKTADSIRTTGTDSPVGAAGWCFTDIVLRFQGNSDLTARDISIVPAGKSLKNLKRAGGKRALLRVCLLVKNSLRYRFKFELRFHEVFRPDRASLFFRRAVSVLNCGKSENPSKEDRGARAANRA